MCKGRSMRPILLVVAAGRGPSAGLSLGPNRMRPRNLHLLFQIAGDGQSEGHSGGGRHPYGRCRERPSESEDGLCRVGSVSLQLVDQPESRRR